MGRIVVEAFYLIAAVGDVLDDLLSAVEDSAVVVAANDLVEASALAYSYSKTTSLALSPQVLVLFLQRPQVPVVLGIEFSLLVRILVLAVITYRRLVGSTLVRI